MFLEGLGNNKNVFRYWCPFSEQCEGSACSVQGYILAARPMHKVIKYLLNERW